jgi:hypothetical protein
MREIALSVIDIAIMGGLLWSLWFVWHSSRRRTKRIKDELAGPITPTADAVLVGRNRKAVVPGVVILTLIAIRAASEMADETALAVIIVLICGASAYGLARIGLARGPALIMDGKGMTINPFGRLIPSRKLIPWESVHGVWVEERRGLYGISRHELTCEYEPDGSPADELNSQRTTAERVTLPLDTLSMPWNDITQAIQDRLGRRVVLEKR